MYVTYVCNLCYVRMVCVYVMYVCMHVCVYVMYVVYVMCVGMYDKLCIFVCMYAMYVRTRVMQVMSVCYFWFVVYGFLCRYAMYVR